MLCKVCRDGLGSIEKLNRLCLVERHVADAGTVSEYWHQPKHQPFLANFWYAYGHHRDEVSFARSAGQLCVMCSDFPFRDDESDRVSKVRKLGFFTIFWISYENGNPSMTVDSGYGLKTVSLVPVKTKSILDDVLNFDLDYSTDSERTWMMISNWMEACSSYHDRCKNQSQGDTYRPARLLEIHYPKCPHPQSPPMFRLVKGDHCPQNTRYVTLSYRWGDKPLENTIRLLKTTCAWLGELNPIGRLPKTFRDAMRIAHRFSIRYLWIDRLCIYQDSVEDWRREAGSVQDVYRNASFCISALSAEDDEGGCFFPRDPSLVAPTAVKLNGDDGTYRVDLEDITWNSTFQDEPLTRRAWVLQERLMAPRTIHFGRRQVFWECSELHACETHPKGFGEFHPSNHFDSAQVDRKCDGVSIPLWKQLIATPTIPRTTKDSQARTFTDWSTIITLYSGTKLTVPSDKLVAVSGLAKDVRKRLQCIRPGQHRYLAGLWEDVLMETLLWYVQVGSPARRAADYRAPSWSWASLDGNLIMPDMFLEETIELCSILSTDMEFLGGDDTGEVKGGTLTLYGPVCRVKLSALSDNQYSTEAFRRFDGHVTESGKIDDSWLPVSTVIFDTKDDLGEDIFCIWLIAQPPALRGWQTSGLALQRVGDDMFQRVGTVYSYHMNQAEAENFVEAFVRREIQVI